MMQRYHGRPATQRSAPTSPTGPRPGCLARFTGFLAFALSLSLGAKAQQALPFFRADAEAKGAAAVSPLNAALFHAQALTLDLNDLRAALATAPPENKAAAPLVLALPLPNGGSGRFAIHQAPILAPALAAQFPDINTYAGFGLDDVSASVRLDVTPQGFHAQVIANGNQSFYIDPVTRADVQHYLAFYKRDMNRAVVGKVPICAAVPTPAFKKAAAARRASAAAQAAGPQASGSRLRTYRLALACTPEYALTKGNTVASVMAGEATTVNRVVGVYEKELAVRLVLVPNNSRLIFLSGTGPQPARRYINNNGDIMLYQNQFTVDSLIGNANYDIGHVVSTGGGGVAYLGVVCANADKARGVTGATNPVGDAFDIDYVAHEMGHQFGASHPFNGEGGLCGNGNRDPTTAWEPGSGSTIMAYAGICGTANDLQANSDPVFHTGNYEEIRAFVDGTTCGTRTATGNTAPTVTAPVSGKTLPINTPFKLTASATDAENDPLTYSWEELDLGSPGSPNDPQRPGDNVPLFRSFLPNISPTRYFPRLTDLLANTTVLGERLPTVTRLLTFRCTARDQHSGPAGVIGGVNFSSLVTLNVSNTSGPFVLTAPNTAVTWTGGAAQTVTWNVAGTTNAPVSCALVNVRLSLDGGLTYPTLLAQNVPNSGSAVVVAPSPATTQTQARVMVEAADNYFFDISNTNFTITTPAPGPTITSFTPTGGNAGTVVRILGSNFSGVTAVSFNGTAAASFAVISATQLSATVAAGTSTGPITITAPTGAVTSATPFVVGAPPIITSFTPTTGPVGASVVITGTSFSGATQVAFNGTVAPTFTVNSATQITATVPAGATTGPIAVTTGVATGVSAANFDVIPAPVIASFTPPAGQAGTVVVLTGNYFTSATQVTFNGTAAPSFTVNSSTQLTVTVPAGASSGFIAVTGPGGVGTSPVRFLVPPANDLCGNALPLICGQTVTGTTVGATDTGDPTSDCITTMDEGGVFYTIIGTGGNITLSTCSGGTDYDTKLFVYRGGCGAFICVAGNDDATSCPVNSGASTLSFPSVAGRQYMVFVSGYLNDEGAFELSADCAPATPVVSSLSPASGPAGTVVTLTGTSLNGATLLTLNGVAVVGFTVVNASTITFTIPTGATSGNVVVNTPVGASNGQAFAVTTTTATANANQSQFRVWPNPVAGQGSWHVTLATPATKATLTLRNVLGQLISTRAFSGSETELPATGLAAGIYLLTVQTEGRAPSVQRVVVE